MGDNRNINSRTEEILQLAKAGLDGNKGAEEKLRQELRELVKDPAAVQAFENRTNWQNLNVFSSLPNVVIFDDGSGHIYDIDFYSSDLDFGAKKHELYGYDESRDRSQETHKLVAATITTNDAGKETDKVMSLAVKALDGSQTAELALQDEFEGLKQDPLLLDSVVSKLRIRNWGVHNEPVADIDSDVDDTPTYIRFRPSLIGRPTNRLEVFAMEQDSDLWH